MSTMSPGLFGPVPKAPRAQPDVPGDSNPALMARRVDQLSQETRAYVRGPTGLTSSPGGITLGSEVPWG